MITAMSKVYTGVKGVPKEVYLSNLRVGTRQEKYLEKIGESCPKTK